MASPHVASVIPVAVSVVLLTIGVVPTLFSVILSQGDMVFLQVVGDEQACANFAQIINDCQYGHLLACFCDNDL